MLNRVCKSGVCLAFLLLFFSPCAEVSAYQTVEDWIQNSSVAIDFPQDEFDQIDRQFAAARVVALGEATHGQHEVFALKRHLTMHLVRKHGFRIVAYEASSSSLLDADDYVSGKSDDRPAALAALGMLIWQIEENGQLLDDLRTWNQQAANSDPIRLIGIDAQDAEAALKQLNRLIQDEDPDLAKKLGDLSIRAKSAGAELMNGNRDPWDTVAKEIKLLETTLNQRNPADSVIANDYHLRVLEFLHSLRIFSSLGSRDQAMADLLLKQLGQQGAKSRCVVWSHNAHIQHSALRYLNSPELAMGGHLTKALGDDYYAVGVAFGEGEFQANATRVDGKWGFRRYRLSAAPKGSLEAMLGTTHHKCYALDLRTAPKSKSVQQWLASGHGQRWFGGYSVAEDCDARTSDASRLMQTFPREDFDCLLYVAQTRAATPIDSRLIIADP
jgi:erythromycin esterase